MQRPRDKLCLTNKPMPSIQPRIIHASSMASTGVARESKLNVPTELHWQGIALRLVLTVIAGSLLGAERSKSGHVAGLRTTLLVTLAASIAMIQMNLLLPTNGKPADSYAVMDLMRLPLGILTGVGFIGAGAIVRKNELILGVTTAATMWFATVVGLCLGGGQLILGSVSTVIGFGVLWGLRSVETHVQQYELAELKINMQGDWLQPNELRERLKAAGFHLKSLSFTDCVQKHRRKFECEVRWPSSRESLEIPLILAELESMPGVTKLEWKATGSGQQ
jgi:putative Mg2+ transporter-C (MgtC) family protein